MPPSEARRVSYVIPSPAVPPPYLSLPSPTHPRNGSPHPILIKDTRQPSSSSFRSRPSTPTNNYQPSSSGHNPFTFDDSSSTPPRPPPPAASCHPQHSLGIPALALDCSTQLSGNKGPQGILYTGGRDGLVAGWELGVKMKRRQRGRYGYEDGGRRGWVKWNQLGGGDDEDDYDEEEEAQRDREDDEFEKGGPTGDEATKRIPYEERWELDLQGESFEQAKPPAATFRQCVQYHTDWVNDLVLCNLNQTLISASSDRTIRTWNPHSTEGSMSPTVIGHHTDYVRCLAYSREQQFVASGGFDRQVKLWDINHPTSTSTPLLTLNHAEVTKEKSSIYSLATCPSGNVVAAGSPERVIRVWDPRAGGRRICKLVGHTDNIRALLMLSGSSDATIKLWSLSAQRVLHTFNHHSDSVWSLFSSHPNFERFYSGDRSGNIAVVDMERCSDVSEGECTLLGREGGDPDEAETGGNPLATRGSVGINKIVAMDDAYVWTSTSSSSVNVWKDVGRRTRRVPGFRPSPKFEDEFEDDEHEDEPYARAPLLGASSIRSVDLSPSPTVEPPTSATAPSLAKRLSLDIQGGSSLLPTRSRDSHSVAFAPHSPPSTTTFSNGPTDTYIASILKGGRKDRVASLSGQSIQGSYVSSEQPDAPPRPSSPTLPKPALDGVPYDNLINLGTPDSPYGFSGGRPGPDADIATIYSAASVLSVPNFHRTADHSRTAVVASNGSSLRPTPTIGGSSALPGPEVGSSAMSTRFEEAELVKEAKRDFQERDLVGDAFPLWTSPVGTIEGTHGLVRSLMLNDRQHVITCDTAGVIAVWNILTCHCVGLISSTSVLEAHSSTSSSSSVNGSSTTPALTPREALELVKERIEGEAVTPTWCSVDTRIGGLTVHLEEGRCFDAEIHLDELEDVVGGPFKEDQKVSVGKLILANLFSGFVRAELRRQNPSSFSPPSSPSPSSPSTGFSRQLAPTFIPLSGAQPSSNPFRPSTAVPPTPGGIILLATPAMTPALAPEADDFFSIDRSSTGPRHPTALQSIPGSPMMSTPMTEGAMSKPTSPAEQLSGGRDYFSMRGDRSRATSGRRAATTTGVETSDETPFSPGGGDQPATPGGTFMGKFKGFGKGKKAATGVATPAPVVEVSEEEAQRLADEARWGVLSPRDLYQKRVLSNLLTPPLKPPSPNDVPPMPAFADPAIFVDEESKDAGAWAVIYRGATSSTDEDVDALEMALPVWVLEFLLSGRAALKEPVKMSFVLEPWKGEGYETMEEMPSGNARLTAARSLRVRKICSYISDRLHLAPPRSRAVSLSPTPLGTPHSSSANLQGLNISSTTFGFSPLPQPPQDGEGKENALELVCNGMVLPVKMTLGAVRAFVYRGGGDIVIGYRMRREE